LVFGVVDYTFVCVFESGWNASKVSSFLVGIDVDNTFDVVGQVFKSLAAEWFDASLAVDETTNSEVGEAESDDLPITKSNCVGSSESCHEVVLGSSLNFSTDFVVSVHLVLA